MAMCPLRDLEPGQYGLAEALNDDYSATYMLYRRMAAFPEAYAARPQLAQMLARAVPTLHARTWVMDGSGPRPLDSGLLASLHDARAEELAIPRGERKEIVWGTAPTAPVLPAACPVEAHLLSRERGQELLLARTDGKLVPPFKTLKQRIQPPL